MSAKKTEPAKKVASEFALFGVEGLREHLAANRGWADGDAYNVDKAARAYEVAATDYGRKFAVTWADGKSIEVFRDTYSRDGLPRVVLEAADRRSYDKKAQGKLRRSFVEPTAESFAKVLTEAARNGTRSTRRGSTSSRTRLVRWRGCVQHSSAVATTLLESTPGLPALMAIYA